MSGGITVAAFLPPGSRQLPIFILTFYGTHALQTAIFYSSTEGPAQDISVLVGTAFETLTFGAFR